MAGKQGILDEGNQQVGRVAAVAVVKEEAKAVRVV